MRTKSNWLISQIKAKHNATGGHFFDRSAFQFFDSRINPTVYEGPGGVFFVTSEQYHGSNGSSGARMFTVRQFDPETGDVGTAKGTEFQEFEVFADARHAARRLAKGVYGGV